MKTTTSGERLFLFIKNEILPSIGSGEQNWKNAEAMISQLGGRPEFGLYFLGAMSVYTTRKLLRFWSVEKGLTSNESQYVKIIARFSKRELFPRLDDGLSQKLARYVINAESVSGKSISKNLRNSLLKNNKNYKCYLCGTQLDATEKNEKGLRFITLEHLWPKSIGGDTVEGNLLPACNKCQETTKDTLSWEWLNVHNIVLPKTPSEDALRSINHKERYARHFMVAMTCADQNNCSLKEAFLKIGPLRTDIKHNNTGAPITFFDLLTQ